MQPASKTSSPFFYRGISNGKLTAHSKQPAFEGTIAAALNAGIRLEDFIKMTRFARESDSGAARFLDE